MEHELKHGLARHEVGEYLHASIRKHCDSKQTTLTWYLISTYIWSGRKLSTVWGSYVTDIWLNLDTYTAETIPTLLKSTADAIGNSSSAEITLRLAFAAFTVEDWERAASGLAGAMRRHAAQS